MILTTMLLAQEVTLTPAQAVMMILTVGACVAVAIIIALYANKY